MCNRSGKRVHPDLGEIIVKEWYYCQSKLKEQFFRPEKNTCDAPNPVKRIGPPEPS